MGTSANKQQTVVVKFGGKALADQERLLAVARHLQHEHNAGKRLCVVVSARGNRTDELITLARTVNGNPQGETLDGLVQLGEMEAVFLLGLALQSLGVSVACFNSQQIGLMVKGGFSAALVETVKKPKVITNALDRGCIVIIPGFQGVTDDGSIATLGRGGSDLTAVVVAIHTKATLVVFYKDVDGIYATDPHIVPNALRFNNLSFLAMLGIIREGGERGTLMERSVAMASDHSILLHVCISPSVGQTTGGTTIGPAGSKKKMETPLAYAALMMKPVARVRVDRVPDKPGALASIDEALGDFVIIEQIQDQGKNGVASVAYLVQPDDLTQIIATLQSLDDLTVEGEGGLVAITIKDPAMRDGAGFLRRRSVALRKANVNIVMVLTAHDAITTVVKKEDLAQAANALAEEFNLIER